MHYVGGPETYRYEGAFVYDGKVYDHIRMRIKGEFSTYQVGKNKFKINFNKTHRLEARDNYGNKYKVKLDKINVHTMGCPWWRWQGFPVGAPDIGEGGLIMNEATSLRFYQLAGVPASNSHYVHLRVVDNAQETNPTDQYEGDFWGLYLIIEQPDGRFLDERLFPDGNMYNAKGTGSNKRNQGPFDVTDNSDILAFIANGPDGYNRSPVQPLSWWQANVNLDEYYRYNAINYLVNNSDLRDARNTTFYHNPDSGQWTMLPWDLDLTYEPQLHNSSEPNWEHFSFVFQHTSAFQDYQNRVRDIADLMFSDVPVHGYEAHRMYDEYARILQSPAHTNSWAEANQAMWDYHPRIRNPGQWYDTSPDYPTKDYDGLLAYMKEYVATGYGSTKLAARHADANIPNKPTINYTGMAGFPLNGLNFQSTVFSDATGSFSAMKWRIAEVSDLSNPVYSTTGTQIYEITAIWESADIAPFNANIQIPGRRRGCRPHLSRARKT